MKAQPPPSQAERLKSLRALGILDTPREQEFDEIVELASRICETPISVINLIDEHRQWFKAETGLGVRETPLDTSICAHVILEPDFAVIPDTLEDPRMADNPLCLGEPHLRFYAGALLKTPEGHAIGTLCVLDNKPRDLTDLQRFALQVLAKQVMAQLRLRKLAASQAAALDEADDEIEAMRDAARARDILTQEIDHRVKNSLNTVAAMLNIQMRTASSAEVLTHLTTARDRVMAIAAVHEQLHVTARYDKVEMRAFMDRLVQSLQHGLPENVELHHRTAPLTLDTRRATSLGIIVNELVTNSLKHAFREGRAGAIGIACGVEDGTVQLDVWDNGSGVRPGPESRRDGLGMRVVRSSTEQFGGSVEQRERPGGGTHTSVTLQVE